MRLDASSIRNRTSTLQTSTAPALLNSKAKIESWPQYLPIVIPLFCRFQQEKSLYRQWLGRGRF
jgi:hypothetical protein